MQRLAQARDVAVRVVGTYRAVMMTPPSAARCRCWRELLAAGPDRRAARRPPPAVELPDALPFRQRLLRVNLNVVPLLGVPRWRELRILTAGPAAS